MIELRWLERDVEKLDPQANIYPARPRETVLQYRVMVDNVVPTTISSVTTVSAIRKGWSSWMDVPKEIEPPQPIPWA